MKKSIRILLADDHTIVRQGLEKLLEGQEGFHIVGEACNGREALEMVAKLRPDVVLMDIAMPLLNGIEATRQIKKQYPEVKIVILSMHAHGHYVNELFEAGVSGYLVKESTGDDIVQAIHAAIRGETFLSPNISKMLVDDYLALKRSFSKENLYNTLSNREREVFQMIAEGRSTKEISEILYISPSTVKTHRAKIMEKLQVDSLPKLIRFAAKLGLTDMEADVV